MAYGTRLPLRELRGEGLVCQGRFRAQRDMRTGNPAYCKSVFTSYSPTPLEFTNQLIAGLATAIMRMEQAAQTLETRGAVDAAKALRAEVERLQALMERATA